MASLNFPIANTDGQLYNLNGAYYVWSNTLNAWTTTYVSSTLVGTTGITNNQIIFSNNNISTGSNGLVFLSSSNTFYTNAISTYTVNSNLITSNTLTTVGSSSLISLILTNAAEAATISATAATGTINFDVATQGVLYYTSNASANWTINFRGSSGTSLNTLMTTGQAISVAHLVTQGSSAYYNNGYQIDGNSVVPLWQGGTAPSSGNASGIDLYTYTIIKTGSATFTVLASLTQYK